MFFKKVIVPDMYNTTYTNGLEFEMLYVCCLKTLRFRQRKHLLYNYMHH